MKRVSNVIVRFDDGTVATARVETKPHADKMLTRGEAKHQHDIAVEKVIEGLKSLPYTPTAVTRNVEIR